MRIIRGRDELRINILKLNELFKIANLRIS